MDHRLTPALHPRPVRSAPPADPRSRPEGTAPISNRRWRRLAYRLSTHDAARYLLVGGVTYLFDIGVLVVLRSGLGLPLPFATTCAFGATTALNFALNRAFAFRSDALLGPALVRYVLLVAVDLLVTVAMVTGLAAVGVEYVVARTEAAVVIAAMNYATYRWWIFRVR